MVGQHERLKIWQKSYDLAKDLMQVTERFPRPQQRDGLASEIRRTSLDLVRTIMLANTRQNTAINQDLDQEIDYLQAIVRMARDLRYISIGQYELLACGIDYLGYIVYRDHRRVRSRNVHRIYHNIKQMEAGAFDRDPRASIASWIGYAQHANTYGLNCQIAKRHPFLRVAFDPVEALS